MNPELLLENLTNPALLFFILGVVAIGLKSDLEIPAQTSRFISMYLLLSIGFRGGQELAHENLNADILYLLIFGLVVAASIPCCTFFILKRKFNVFDAGAVATAYGSVSAVTFVTAAAYMEAEQLTLHGYMIAIMAIMESPAIVIGLLLISWYGHSRKPGFETVFVVRHAMTNASVVLILGSLFIGYLADAKQAQGIKPFTNDLFKGFLAIFLLDMGIASARKLKAFFSYGWFPVVFAAIIPLVNGTLVSLLSSIVTDDIGNRFVLGVLAASASYIAVPAAMKVAVPKADPGLYLPMALAITFPVNITLGLTIYLYLARLA